uniref:PDZ domain-containing protein n=1 Tax=Rhabditophanes sp. KR3021 TaxID=114890 RepID=A0AC35U778_9BILA
MLNLDEKSLKALHSKGNLKKFMDYITVRKSQKIEKMCAEGLDPNFHETNGETPLTLAAGIADNHEVIVQLVGGGAHLDFRNNEGQTGLHKAAFLSLTSNVKTMLELGASPNYRDPIGLTPLYYSMLTADSDSSVTEMLLSESSEIGITDMHGNHEIHQACKNGLAKQVEHLLYYGADANIQNVNGNTPLHVCSVNNQPECARILLFRGAIVTVQNKHGQTALHVAQIIGHQKVCDVITKYNPATVVPYRNTPQYNTRRRVPNSSTLPRRRSLSQASISSSMKSERSVRHQSEDSIASDMSSLTMTHSPSPSRASVAQTIYSSNGNEYGTLKRYAPDQVKTTPLGFEANIPRILVIPRGPKGFGFILRGVKNLENDEIFEPTPLVPGLQFFEGVDMAGIAMKAGLIPGDFLLEINGIDVRRAPHENVVEMIQTSEDTISLKVITVDVNVQNNHYAALSQNTLRRSMHYGMPNRAPPPPPLRHPSTSLSVARGAQLQQSLMPHASMKLPNYNQANQRRISASELEHLMIRRNNMNAAAMSSSLNNHYDINDSASFSNSTNGDYYTTNAKKYNSVADMKRRKQARGSVNGVYGSSVEIMHNNGVPQTPQGHYHAAQQHQMMLHQQQLNQMHQNQLHQQQNPQMFQGYYKDNGLSNFHGSIPNIHQQFVYDSSTLSHPRTRSTHHSVERKSSISSGTEYSKPFRQSMRPKTPPPPPPKAETKDELTPRIPQIDYNDFDSDDTDSIPKLIYQSAKSSTSVNHQPVHVNTPPKINPPSTKPTSSSSVIPPAPPPPPPNLLKSAAMKKNDSIAEAKSPSNPLSGITSAGLASVKLNSVVSNSNNRTDAKPLNTTSQKSNKGPDFDSDLRNALARRRQKVCVEDDEGEDSCRSTEKLNSTGCSSLRESVRENVESQKQLTTKNNSAKKELPNNQNGINLTQKKDSGYTSSRTSLEPSENGDDNNHIESANKINIIRNNVNTLQDNCVSLISQRIEDNCTVRDKINMKGNTLYPSSNKLQSDADNIRDSPKKKYSSYESKAVSAHPQQSIENLEEPARTPPVDYDEPDSGHGDSDQDDKPHIANDYRNKDLLNWTVMDVIDWLSSIRMQEYGNNFQKSRIRGADLLLFDRTKFTQLGVTRIAHRQCMELSLKKFQTNMS